MADLAVVAGPPGAGKSTVAALLDQRHIVVDAGSDVAAVVERIAARLGDGAFRYSVAS